MKIESHDTTVRKLLGSSFFVIPRFQRAYSWSRENVGDFLTDTVVESSGDYFIGGMVAYPLDKKRISYGVVDGQQRLTTIELALCALRDAFASLGEDKLADGLQTLIKRPDENSEETYVLKTETSMPFLADEILEPGEPDLNLEVGREERALKAAYEQLRDFIDAEIDRLSKLSISSAKKAERITKWLKEMRDQVLDLQVIFIEVDNKDNATVIFETLNARGEDLTPADLIKTHLMGYLKPKSRDLDTPLEKWLGIQRKFDASEVEIPLTTFLIHSWQSREEYVGEKSLYKRVKATVKSADAAAYLDALVADAEHYRQLYEPGYRKWPKDHVAAQESLHFLQDFGLRQPMPLLLSLLREYDSNGINIKQLKRGLRAVEFFHFAHTIIAGKSSSGGTSRRYSRLARELRDAKKGNAKSDVINDCEAVLRESMPSKDEFVAGMADLRFTESSTHDKRTVQYVLKRVYQHCADGDVIDWPKMTIEHLAPQSIGTDAVGKLGNLIYVDEKLNTKLSSKPFDAKQRILGKAAKHLWIPGVVLKASTWKAADINKRTRELAVLGHGKVWKL